MQTQQSTSSDAATAGRPLQIAIARTEDELPTWADRPALIKFFHETMKPWHDTLEDVGRALGYALDGEPGTGGFITVAAQNGKLVGALTMLETGMGGYIPEHVLLFVSVDPALRGQGAGRKIIERAIAECDGAVKLHVEYENPAKRLYERIGFSTKYAEMRYVK